eukprot:Skav211453  [mRNA]  locus=scaffold379:96391:108150:- [translate_table: standard]
MVDLDTSAAYCYDNDDADMALCDEAVDDMMTEVITSGLSWIEAVLEVESEADELRQRVGEQLMKAADDGSLDRALHDKVDIARLGAGRSNESAAAERPSEPSNEEAQSAWGPPKKKYAQYGFDHTPFNNKTEALNGFLLRILNPEPGQPRSWNLTGKRVEGGSYSILKLDSRCCAKLWPNLTEKIFEGEICSDKDDAKDSAIDKFFEDPAVKEAAATLPPTKKEQDRIANRNEFFARRARNQARPECRRNRLPEAQQAKSQAR